MREQRLCRAAYLRSGGASPRRGPEPLQVRGRPLLETYGDAGTLTTQTYWTILAAFTVLFLATAWGVLSRSLRRDIR